MTDDHVKHSFRGSQSPESASPNTKGLSRSGQAVPPVACGGDDEVVQFLCVLQQAAEKGGLGPEDRYFAIEDLFEAECLIEALGSIEILCGEERTGQFCPSRNSTHFEFSLREQPLDNFIGSAGNSRCNEVKYLGEPEKEGL